jgi:serine/threonine protein phosphatase 1
LQVHAIRGNHEEQLLEAYHAYDRESLLFFVNTLNKSNGLIDKDGKMKPEHQQFIENLPYYFKLDRFYIVHAGFDWTKPDPFADIDSMLNLRFELSEYNTDNLQAKTMIRGHQVTEIDTIRQAVKNRSAVIPLDNGCVYRKPHKVYDYNKLGTLCCLNMDTFELISVENIDTPRQ